MNEQQEATKNDSIKNTIKSMFKLVLGDARQGIIGGLALIFFLTFLAVVAFWSRRLLHLLLDLYGLSSTEFLITGQTISYVILALLSLFVVLLYVFNRLYRKRREANELRRETGRLHQEVNDLHREVNHLTDELREQADSFEDLIAAHNHLFTKYGLNIISARFGLDASGARADDVTKQIILGLKEKDRIAINLDLVGGEENDPVPKTPKKLYIDYIQGGSFSKEFDENHILSIDDLISKDNESKLMVDKTPSRWTNKLTRR